MKSFNVGFVGFGEINSPRNIIEKKCASALAAVRSLGFDPIHTPPVSDDPAGNDVRRAIVDLTAKPLDALVVCLAGWIPSHAVLSVIDQFRHLPIVLWGLGGYYEGKRLITTADQAGTTALRKTLEDLGYRFLYVYDLPGQPHKTDAIRQFLVAAKATLCLRNSRIGMMGYRDMKLYATLADSITLKRTLGVEIDCFEMLEMVQRSESVTDQEVEALLKSAIKEWTFDKQADPATLQRSGRYYLALKAIIEERGFDAISLVDVDGMKKLLKLPPAMIFMLLSDEVKLPTIPENDSLGSVTQLIVRYLTEQAAAYFEFYEFLEDRVLMGVPDYVPAAVINGKRRVCPTRFGSFSEGILDVSKVKTGPVTLARLVPEKDGFSMHVVTGNAVDPRPWEEAGWEQPAPQLPGIEVILDTPVEVFAEKVAGQHYILAYGNVTGELKAFCRLNRIAYVQS